MEKHSTTPEPLSADDLYVACELDQIPFSHSDEASALDGVVGQDRALEALKFGTRISESGYNVFALGPSGVGKRTIIERLLEQESHKKLTPPDWCYVHNFEEPHKPKALPLPAGHGTVLRKQMEQFREDVKTAIPAAFETENYQAQIETLEPKRSPK